MGKELVLRKVTLKNVLTPTGERDIEVQVVPFDRRKDEHTDFAYAYIDMLGRMPSEFRNMSDASKPMFVSSWCIKLRTRKIRNRTSRVFCRTPEQLEHF